MGDIPHPDDKLRAKEEADAAHASARREKEIEIFSKHGRQIGGVTVTMTFGRLNSARKKS